MQGGAFSDGGANGRAGSKGIVPRAGSAARGGAASESGGSDHGEADGGEAMNLDCAPDDDTLPELDGLEPNPSCAEESPAAWNIARGGIATSSDGAESNVAKAFDEHSGTSWQSQSSEAWLAYEFPGQAAHVATSYRLTSTGMPPDGQAFGDPTGWELQGSNDPRCADNLEWVTLDTRADQTFSARYEARTYSFENTTAFHRYRLNITSSGSAPSVRLAELELFSPGTPLFNVDDAAVGTAEHQFHYSGGWTGHSFDNNSERFDGTTSWCNQPGESATVDFVGSQVRLFGVTDPGHGIVGVSVDGGDEVEVDLYAAGPTTFNRLVYQSPNLCPGSHSIRVSVTGKKNPASTGIYASLDRLQVVP